MAGGASGTCAGRPLFYGDVPTHGHGRAEARVRFADDDEAAAGVKALGFGRGDDDQRLCTPLACLAAGFTNEVATDPHA